MEKEYCFGWHLVYDALRDYYYRFGESVQKEFNRFYDPLHFFAPDSLTVGIPLSVGKQAFFTETIPSLTDSNNQEFAYPLANAM